MVKTNLIRSAACSACRRRSIALCTRRNIGNSPEGGNSIDGEKKAITNRIRSPTSRDVDAQPTERMPHESFFDVDTYKRSIQKRTAEAQKAVYTRVEDGVKYAKDNIYDASSTLSNAAKEKKDLASAQISKMSKSGSEATRVFAANLSARAKENLSEASTRLSRTANSGIDDAKNTVQSLGENARARVAISKERVQNTISTTINNSKETVIRRFEQSKTQLADAGNDAKNIVQNLGENAQSRIADAVSKEKIQNTIGSTLNNSKEAVFRRLEQSKSQLADAGSRGSSVIAEKAQIGLENSKRVVTNGISSASSSALGAASSMSKTFYQKAAETIRPALSWLWWWSLAAIGVYTIASAGTKEIVRQTFEWKSQQKEVSQQATKEEPGEVQLVEVAQEF